MKTIFETKNTLKLFYTILILFVSNVWRETVASKKVEYAQFENCEVKASKAKETSEAVKSETEMPEVQITVSSKFKKDLSQAHTISEDLDKEPENAFFVDFYGYKHNWTDLEEGWTEKRRKKFFREHRRNSEQADIMPQFTKLGYKKMKMPEGLHQYILKNRLVDEQYDEACTVLFNCDRIVKFTKDDDDDESGEGKNPKKFMAFIKKNVSRLMKWKDEAVNVAEIENQMKPVLESWIGGQIPLAFSQCYGVRRYFRGATMGLHLDRPTTHVISAVLQIDQDVTEDWPLTVVDFNFKSKNVTLKPGEMVLYESAKMPHGRQFPLNGNYFDNVFVHFRPANRWYTDADFPEDNNASRAIRKIKLEDLIVPKQ